MPSSYTQLLAPIALAVPVGHIAYKLLWDYVARRAVDKTTILNELPFLGKGRLDGKKIQGTAVIAGGSFAGLTAARVCSDYFDTVIIVEPDELTPGAKRTRIPQFHQSHGLQPVSPLLLKAFFPNLDEALAKFGVHITNGQARFMIDGSNIGFKPGSLPDGIVCSRPCLEDILRSLVLAIPNVKHARGLVQGVTASLNGQQIETVQFKPLDVEELITLPCAFFADCTGPACGGIKWIDKAQGANWEQPKRSLYDPKISYTTATIPIPERVRHKLPLFDHPAYPGGYDKLTHIRLLTCGRRDDRGLMVYRIEGDRLMLTSGGWAIATDDMPKTLPQFIELMDFLYRKSLNGATEEHVLDTLRMIATTLEEDHIEANFLPNRLANCYLVDYQNAKVLPSNFAALGDSIARVNPVYGQGMSKAIMDGATLNGALRSTNLVGGEDGKYTLPASFQKEMVNRQLPRIFGCWEASKFSDYGRATTIPVEGENLEMGKFQREYGEALFRLAGNDIELSDTVVRSMGFIRPNLDLLKPSILFRALWNMWTYKI